MRTIVTICIVAMLCCLCAGYALAEVTPDGAVPMAVYGSGMCESSDLDPDDPCAASPHGCIYPPCIGPNPYCCPDGDMNTSTLLNSYRLEHAEAELAVVSGMFWRNDDGGLSGVYGIDYSVPWGVCDVKQDCEDQCEKDCTKATGDGVNKTTVDADGDSCFAKCSDGLHVCGHTCPDTPQLHIQMEQATASARGYWFSFDGLTAMDPETGETYTIIDECDPVGQVVCITDDLEPVGDTTQDGTVTEPKEAE